MSLLLTCGEKINGHCRSGKPKKEKKEKKTVEQRRLEKAEKKIERRPCRTCTELVIDQVDEFGNVEGARAATVP